MTDIDKLHPPHDIPPRRPLPTSVLAEWETGTFIENLAAGAGAGWWVTIPSHRRVELVATDGTRLTSVAFAGQVTGVVAEPGGTAIVSGERAEGGWALHRVLPSKPTPQRLCDLPGVQFANGLVRYRSRLVVADSAAGKLTVADLVAGTVRVALEHELLAPVDPHGPLPGVNGLTVDAAGDLLLTNTSRSLLLRLRGEPEQGRLTREAERLVGDDLAAHPDGTVYIATHTYNSILQLTPDGRRLDIATDADGVVGPTSVALTPDQRSLVACTTGGLLSPPPSGPQPARLVRIELDPNLWIGHAVASVIRHPPSTSTAQTESLRGADRQRDSRHVEPLVGLRPPRPYGEREKSPMVRAAGIPPASPLSLPKTCRVPKRRISR